MFIRVSAYVRMFIDKDIARPCRISFGKTDETIFVCSFIGLIEDSVVLSLYMILSSFHSSAVLMAFRMTCIEQCTCYSFQTPYEIEGDTVCGDHHEGPRRGRLKVPAVPHRADGTMIGPSDEDSRGPFTGLWLCAFGSLGLLQLSDFMSLAHDGGASRVFEKPADLTAAMEVFLKLEAQKSTGVRRPRAMILTNHNPPEFDASKCLGMFRHSAFLYTVCSCLIGNQGSTGHFGD